MVTVTDAMTLIDYSNDYTSRLVTLGLLLVIHTFIFFYVKTWQDEFEWQRARNWFLKIFSFWMVALSLIYVPAFLATGFTLEALLNYILNFYQIGLVLTTIIIWIAFYDYFMLMFDGFLEKYNSRRNYIFPKMNRGKR